MFSLTFGSRTTSHAYTIAIKKSHKNIPLYLYTNVNIYTKFISAAKKKKKLNHFHIVG